MVRVIKLLQHFNTDNFIHGLNWIFTGCMFYISFLTNIIEHADTWVVKVPVGILILANALLTVAKAYEKFKNPNNGDK